MHKGEVTIREICREDNAVIAKIIRDTLTEFKANKLGTVFYDDETDHLFEAFQITGAKYFVAVLKGGIAGGAGFYPTAGLPAGTCEIVKMYLLAFARGRGIAKQLIEQCMSESRAAGYNMMYLETMPELSAAITLYEKYGFEFLEGPMGNSGHNGCSKWMLKKL